MMMLYSGYQAWNDMMAPARFGAQIALSFKDRMGPAADWAMPRRMFALMDVFQGAKLTHRRPAYGITEVRSEEHTSELQSLMRISYAVFCLKKKKNNKTK